jgi:UDP-N-acetylmuramoyl-L-alanyl-D-glutamate--2,6-diaminopimelate ligase
MGKAAAVGADWCMLTSDNPRTEDPNLILQQVVHGAESAQRKGLCSANHKIFTQVDRHLAIQEAVAQLEPGDVLLVAGKGHEPYQEINGVRHNFDDCTELQEAVRCCS